jgi:hypothetical protein
MTPPDPDPMSAGRSGSASRPSALAAELAAIAFFLVLSLWALRPLPFQMASATLDHGDAFVDIWTIHWLVTHLLDPAQVFQGNIFHPARHAVLHSDLSLGTVVLLFPLRLVLRDPLVLYNAGLVVAIAFGGWAFRLLAFRLTGNHAAGLVCGVVAAFASHQMRHVYHINLLTIGWLALFLLGLHMAIERPTLRASVLSGVSFALSAQSSGYYAVAAVLLALVFAAVHFRPLLADRRRLLCIAAAIAIAIALTAPYLMAYLDVREEQGLRRPLGMSVSMAFRPGVDISSDTYLYRQLFPRDGERLFPGMLALGLGLIALIRRAKGALFYASAATALLVFSLGPSIRVGSAALRLPYLWVFSIPPLDSMRHPYTFAAVALFALAVLAGLGWARLGFASRRAAGAVVVAIAVAETLAPPPSIASVEPGLPPVYHLVRALPLGPILEVPLFSEQTLLWAARHGLPTVNGQGAAFVPALHLNLNRYIQNHWIKNTPENIDTTRPMELLLGSIPTRYVIVPSGRRPSMRPLAEAFGRSELFREVARSPDGDRIYELARR